MLAVHFSYLLSRSQGLLCMSQNFFQIFACSTSFHASSWKYSCSSLVYFSISSTESFCIVSPPPHYKPLCYLLDWNVSADYFSQLPVCWFVPSIDFFPFLLYFVLCILESRCLFLYSYWFFPTFIEYRA